MAVIYLSFNGTLTRLCSFEDQNLQVMRIKSIKSLNGSLEITLGGTMPATTPWFLDLFILPIVGTVPFKNP